MVEVFKAIHEEGRFGDIPLKTMFEVVGRTFDCNDVLKNHYRLFWEIKNRKKDEPTKFIDKLREAILRLVEKSLK